MREKKIMRETERERERERRVPHCRHHTREIPLQRCQRKTTLSEYVCVLACMSESVYERMFMCELASKE